MIYFVACIHEQSAKCKTRDLTRFEPAKFPALIRFVAITGWNRSKQDQL
jgi:hypothetical protein